MLLKLSILACGIGLINIATFKYTYNTNESWLVFSGIFLVLIAGILVGYKFDGKDKKNLEQR